MEIEIIQIKAARQLLEWTQQDLATHSGLAISSIRNYEAKTSNPNSTSLQQIIDAFTVNGIEFIEGGARLKSLKTRTFRGQKGFIEFMNLVYETARDVGGEFCVSHVDEDFFVQSMGEKEDARYTKRMTDLAGNFSFRILIKEGDMNFSGGAYAQYKWIPEDQFHSVPFYVFGDNLAFLIFEKQPIIHLINNAEIANAQRVQFNLSWDNAKETTCL